MSSRFADFLRRASSCAFSAAFRPAGFYPAPVVGGNILTWSVDTMEWGAGNSMQWG